MRYFTVVNTLRPRQNGRHFPDDIFKWIFLNEIIWISMKMSLKVVPRGSINNILALVQIMTWRHPGDKPLSEPMMVRSLTHICVIRPQWVKLSKLQTIKLPVIWNALTFTWCHPNLKNKLSRLHWIYRDNYVVIQLFVSDGSGAWVMTITPI